MSKHVIFGAVIVFWGAVWPESFGTEAATRADLIGAAGVIIMWMGLKS